MKDWLLVGGVFLPLYEVMEERLEIKKPKFKNRRLRHMGDGYELIQRYWNHMQEV